MSENARHPYIGFSSAAIHAGHKTDSNYAHLTPIYASSTTYMILNRDETF